MATVYLKSKTGRSPLLESRAIPSDIAPYLAAPETFQRAAAELGKFGFTIEAQGVTLSISGSRELFEQTFGVRIFSEEKAFLEPGKPHHETIMVYRSSQTVMKIPGLEDVIEGVVLSSPAVLF